MLKFTRVLLFIWLYSTLRYKQITVICLCKRDNIYFAVVEHTNIQNMKIISCHALHVYSSSPHFSRASFEQRETFVTSNNTTSFAWHSWCYDYKDNPRHCIIQETAFREKKHIFHTNIKAVFQYKLSVNHLHCNVCQC